MNEQKQTGGEGKGSLQNYIGYAASVFLIGAYVAAAFFQFGKSEKSIYAILADGITALLLGIAMARLLSLQGILKGKNSREYLSTLSLHGQAVKDIIPFIGGLDRWCEQKTADMLRILRTKILAARGLCYSDCFRDGVALGYREPDIPSELLPSEDVQTKADKLREARKKKQLKAWYKEEKARRKCYKKAASTSITPLMGSILTGSYIKVEDPFNFGKSVAEYEAGNTRNGAIYRILSSCIFGYFGVDLVKNFTLEELLYRVLQVAVAVTFGVIQLYRSYLFIVEDKRGYMIKKIDYLQMFYADCQKQEAEKEEIHGENDHNRLEDA